jgi:CheY-like chemotaxis protein
MYFDLCHSADRAFNGRRYLQPAVFSFILNTELTSFTSLTINIVALKTQDMVVLSVDDDIDDLDLFREALKDVDKSIVCVSARSAQEALNILRDEDLRPDHIFLDINMPVMNGRECLEKIKENPKLENIPVVMYSTTSNSQEIKACKKLGAEFLTKPNRYTDLVKSLSHIVAA